mgnify:CR=1 FL=1
MNAEIISVGTELLLGHTINTDAAFVARELSAIGVNLLFACTVGDNPGRLRDALEEALGRSDVVITTGGLGPTDDDLTKETIASVAGAPLKIHEDSLRRLHTDHLDVLYTHWQSPDFGVYPLEETMEAMMKLKEQGKIRAIGASNVTSDIIRGYCKYGQLDVIQEKYSLLTRRVEKQLLPTCKELGVSVQAYSPLEQGLLTGKVTMDTTYPEGSTRNTNPCFQPTRRAQALELLAKWSDLTEKYDCTMAQLVIAMTARMIPGLHVLCGARKPEQVLDNAGAMHIKLDGADAVRMKWDVDAIS